MVTTPAYRTSIVVEGPNGQNINVFHNSNAAVGPDDFGPLARELYEGFYTNLLSLYPSDCTFAIDNIVDLSTDPPTYVGFDSTPFDLEPSGGLEDFRLAATIGWKSSVASRRARGRTFIGPLNSSSINAFTGLFSDDVLSTLNTAATTFLAAGVAAEAPLVVYSRIGNLTYPVIAHKSNNRTKTLRSRSLR